MHNGKYCTDAHWEKLQKLFAEKILSCMDMILNPSCGWQAKTLKLKLNWKINNLWSLGAFRTFD